MKTFFIPLAILTIASSSALAHDWDSNPDMQQSILNDHASGFVGTSFSSAKPARGSGDVYGWVVLDAQAGDVRASAGREKGQGDAYGSILNDL